MKTTIFAAALVAAIAVTPAIAAETQQDSTKTTVQTDANGKPVASKTETKSEKSSTQANQAVQTPAGSATTTTTTTSTKAQ